MELNFYDCTQENLEKVYSDYVKRVETDHNLVIATNVLCMTDYKKPKINWSCEKEYIKTDYKLMTSTLCITWQDGQNTMSKKPYILFAFGNISQYGVIKFARMEDIDWNKI